METKELTCIGCPIGCQITVTLDNGAVASVSGNTCKIGDNYARTEVVRPMRMVTGTMRVLNSSGKDMAKVPVKTSANVPKSAIFDVMNEIHQTSVTAPVKIGDVLIHDAAHTGVDIVAVKDILG